MSLSTMAYSQVTARSLGPQVLEWMADLTERFGDARVAAMIEAEAPRGDYSRLLGRVRDRLAHEDAQARSAEQPRHHLTGREVLAVVRGNDIAPDGTWTYDVQGLTGDEYGELVLWAGRRAGNGAPPVTDDEEEAL